MTLSELNALPVEHEAWWNTNTLAEAWGYTGLEAAMPGSPREIPPPLMRGLRDYALHGTPTGSFLEGVLTGNLYQAVKCADRESMRALKAIVMLLANHPAFAFKYGDAAVYWRHIATKRETTP